MPEYRTLIIAPPSDLINVDNEVQQVINLLGSKVLQGDQADIHGLLAMVAYPFDIVWFATHGDETGVYLKDGVLSISDITTFVRSVGAKLVVLNTCSSRPIALSIYDEIRIPLVCTIKEVPDRTAFFTGAIFARKIAEGMNFRNAYESAKPGQNSTYEFIPKDYKGEMLMPQPEHHRVDEDIHNLVGLVKRLEIIVSGNPDYNVEGLVPTVRMLTKRVEQLIEDFQIMRSNQAFNRRVLVFLTFLSITLLLAVSILVYQRWMI